MNVKGPRYEIKSAGPTIATKSGFVSMWPDTTIAGSYFKSGSGNASEIIYVRASTFLPHQFLNIEAAIRLVVTYRTGAIPARHYDAVVTLTRQDAEEIVVQLQDALQRARDFEATRVLELPTEEPG